MKNCWKSKIKSGIKLAIPSEKDLIVKLYTKKNI